MLVIIWTGFLKFLSAIAEMIFYAILTLAMVGIITMVMIGLFALASQL